MKTVEMKGFYVIDNDYHELMLAFHIGGTDSWAFLLINTA
jgi:hypothetical protein